jgi:hypothetical protein
MEPPIYAELAGQWASIGRTVPGVPDPDWWAILDREGSGSAG